MRAAGPARTLFTSPRWDCRFSALTWLRRHWRSPERRPSGVLAAWLASHSIDTLVIGGYSTSGCVRASALDALQNGFRPIVVREACADRDGGPHENNLFDLNAKYADVISLEEALPALQR